MGHLDDRDYFCIEIIANIKHVKYYTFCAWICFSDPLLSKFRNWDNSEGYRILKLNKNDNGNSLVHYIRRKQWIENGHQFEMI